MDTVFPVEKWGERVKQELSSYQMVSSLLIVSHTLLYVCVASFSVGRKYNIKTVKFIWSKFN